VPTSARPSPRTDASLVLDARRQRLVLFGGGDLKADGVVYSPDTWVLPLAAGASWSATSPAGESPEVRDGAAAVYDPRSDQVILLQGRVGYRGGYYFDSENDVWAFESRVSPPVTPALVGVHAGPLHVVIEWRSDRGAAISGSVERRIASGVWAPVGKVQPDAEGILRFEDAQAPPGTHCTYRLTWSTGAAAGATPPVELDVPSLRFALPGPTPNPAVGGLTVAFSLPDAERASLEVVDISGRRVFARDVGAYGAGDHSLSVVPGGPLAPGVYFVRLTRGGSTLVARACVVR